MKARTGRRLIAIAAAAITATSISAAGAEEKVKLSLEWLISGRHVGFFVAKEKGFYKEEGLNVDIERGYGTADSIKRISTGSADFAILSVASLMAAKGESNPPVMLVASFFNKGPEAILFLKSSTIKAPKDLAGKRIGSASAGSSLDLLEAFAKSTGLSGYRSVTMASDQTYPALLTKQVDAITGFTDNAAVMRPIAMKKGDDIEVMPYSDYGVDNYGTGIVVNTKLAASKSPKIGAFLKGSLRGIAWSIAHPEEAVAILRKHVPTISADVALATWKIDEKLIVSDETRKHGLGYLSKERMAVTHDMAQKYMGLTKPVPLDTVYTAEFIPRVAVP